MLGLASIPGWSGHELRAEAQQRQARHVWGCLSEAEHVGCVEQHFVVYRSTVKRVWLIDEDIVTVTQLYTDTHLHTQTFGQGVSMLSMRLECNSGTRLKNAEVGRR